MIFKIKKYVKVLICGMLAFALLLPSYATTVGANDAFVTKEEFDIALADFNKRLTVFESGINSKIDNQVTTYLDRNGIWSEVDQTVPTGKIDWTKRSATYKKFFYQNTAWSGSLTVPLYLGGVVAFKASKSGMIFLNCHDEIDLSLMTYDWLATRCNIGVSFRAAAASNWTVDNCASGKIRLLKLKPSMKDAPLGQIFTHDSDNSVNQTPTTFDGNTYYLEDEIDKIVAEVPWATPHANVGDSNNLLNRFSLLDYQGQMPYQLIGFVDKNSMYAVGFYAVFSAWAGSTMTYTLSIAPHQQFSDGWTELGLPGCRPFLVIDKCKVY